MISSLRDRFGQIDRTRAQADGPKVGAGPALPGRCEDCFVRVNTHCGDASLGEFRDGSAGAATDVDHQSIGADVQQVVGAGP